MSLLEITQLTKSFEKGKEELTVLKDITLHAKKGEFITVIGPSGCGKSTLLKAIAGLDTEYSGEIKLDGDKIAGAGINQGFIFQEPRLFPWLTVEKNIAGNLSLKNTEVKESVKKLMELVRLDGFEKAYPKELSGGMQQRVSICRALVHDPGLLLLDEPFGALDAMTRNRMNIDLADIWARSRKTTILITHSVSEAVFLADRVVVMSARPGRVQAVVDVPIPRPRTVQTRASDDFAHLIQQVGAHIGFEYL